MTEREKNPNTRGGLNALDFSFRDLKKRRPISNDDPAAADVQDPHRWENPDPGLLSRITPDSTIGWLGSIASLLIIAGLIAYLAPIFWPVIANPVAIGLISLGGYTTAVWLHGRRLGWDAFRRTTKSIVYLGDDVIVRAGEQPDELPGDAAREYFIPYRSVSWGGFRKRALLKRDLPYDPKRLRSTSPHVRGDDPVIDRLNATTQVVETDTLGRVMITHGSTLDYDPSATVADRYVELPEIVDRDTVDDLKQMMTMLQTELKQQQIRLDMLRESNRELRDLKEAQQLPDMEMAIEIIDRVGDKLRSGQRPQSANTREQLRRLRRAADGAEMGESS